MWLSELWRCYGCHAFEVMQQQVQWLPVSASAGLSAVGKLSEWLSALQAWQLLWR